MPQQTLEEKIKKYAPSGMKLIFNGGVAILLSLMLGLIYAMYFMSVPADLASDKESEFRQGLGVGFGIIYLALPCVTILIVRYLIQLHKAQKLGLEEYLRELSSKKYQK